MADTTFTIQVKVDSRGAITGLNAVEGKLDKVQRKASGTGNLLKKAFAGVAVGQAAVQSVRFLANFSQEMSTVKAISKATGTEFDALRSKAIDLGTTTRYTATQAASGMLFLARSGYNANQILEAIPGTLNLAQSGALSLGRAADIATNILKGFGLSTSETARVVDVLALSANSANTTVEQMGQAMKFVAPIASGVRMSLEETAAAVQVLSNAGIQASMAGTGLRRVLGALEGPTTAQRKVLAQLGLTVDDVKVSEVGLVGALKAIREKTNDVGIALKLFGQRGGPAAEVMAKMLTDMEKFAAANELAAGEATRVAAIMDDNLNGAILRVKSAFQGFLILLGDVQGVSVLRSFLEGLATTFRFLAKNAEGFNNAMKVVTVSLIIFTLSTKKAALAFARFRVIMAANPFAVLLTILTVLVASITFMKDEITLAGAGFVTLGDIMAVTADFIRDAWNSLANSIGLSFLDLKHGWKGLMENMVTFFLATAMGLAKGFDFIIGVFKGGWAALKLIGIAIKQHFDNVWKSIGNGAIDIVGGAINFMIDLLNDLRSVIGMEMIPKIDLEYLKSPTLKKEAMVSGEQIGAAFVAGLGETANQDVLTGIMDEAERRRLERMRRLGQKEPVPTPPTPPQPDIYSPDITEGRGKLPPTFGELAAAISQETELLKLNSREMEIQEGLIKLEEKLKRSLNGVEEHIATGMLRELQVRREMAQLYDQIRGPREDLIAQENALNRLFTEGRINIEEYTLALDQMRIATLDLNRDINSGLQRGLLRIKLNIQDLASVAEQTLTNAFSGAENAITEFVTTGELKISELVDSILQDLTRLLVRKALLSLIPGLGPAAAITAQHGTQFTVGGSGGTDSQMIPLRATPGERVTVETPAQQAKSESTKQGEAPNITIINVSDPNEIAEAMAAGNGEKAILNVISRNRSTVRNALA